ncbi:iron-sulfur cluster biosynthesis family protein [Gottfriedia solisilvae]|uniref:Core domain-containing protein n=1 Tax=Gottfriedia solisilvae TaxID=1516104 RepID=A0A8J3AKJ2_9BACI|nr:iron-sulfur cluster biosynthesis family protein [Gottfriedia solisilvae]GGI12647.1 hypothetical protein GCM10007380_13960 [Gottfriedia solisilvae]
MDFQITDSAKEVLSNKMDENQFIQLSFDRGSCDIVNNIYEMKVINKRPNDAYEKILTVDNIEFLVNNDFEEVYDNQLVIDYLNGSFIFKNKNQIFNNKIGLRYV